MLNLKSLDSSFEEISMNLSRRGNKDLVKQLEILRDLLPQRRQLLQDGDELRAKRNSWSSKFSGKIEDPTILAQIKELKKDIEDNSNNLLVLEEKIQSILLEIPNVLDESVPIGNSEQDNVEIEKWGSIPTLSFTPLSHEELGKRLGILDIPRGVKISGSRFYTLRKEGALLERAIAQFFLDSAIEAGYSEVFAPFLVKGETMLKTGQLPKFQDEVFKIQDSDLYLIPTSEVSLTALYQEEILKIQDFPIRYCSYSSCFRKEAGSYGRDTKGIFRVHQFQKVELIHYSLPENSMNELEFMVSHAQSLLQALELPYRKMLLCSGDIGFTSKKTYDLEVFLPSENRYREISSCSNCGDFQAIRANIKYKNAEGKNIHIHTLNGSGLAVGRTWIAIVENYQREDGTIEIPSVLQKYMGGKTRIGGEL